MSESLVKVMPVVDVLLTRGGSALIGSAVNIMMRMQAELIGAAVSTMLDADITTAINNVRRLLTGPTGGLREAMGLTRAELILRGPGNSAQFSREWDDDAARYLACVTAGFSPSAFDQLKRVFMRMNQDDRLRGVSSAGDDVLSLIGLHAALNGVITTQGATSDQMDNATNQLTGGDL